MAHCALGQLPQLLLPPPPLPAGSMRSRSATSRNALSGPTCCRRRAGWRTCTGVVHSRGCRPKASGRHPSHPAYQQPTERLGPCIPPTLPSHRVVHRDIKPANLLLDERGLLKIAGAWRCRWLLLGAGAGVGLASAGPAAAPGQLSSTCVLPPARICAPASPRRPGHCARGGPPGLRACRDGGHTTKDPRRPGLGLPRWPPAHQSGCACTSGRPPPLTRCMPPTPLPAPQVGTSGFMAPELYHQECQTTAADIYSLGVSLFELCALRSPLGAAAATSEAAEDAAAARWSAGDAAAAAASLAGRYSPELLRLLQAMLQVNSGCSCCRPALPLSPCAASASPPKPPHPPASRGHPPGCSLTPTRGPRRRRSCRRTARPSGWPRCRRRQPQTRVGAPGRSMKAIRPPRACMTAFQRPPTCSS